ncbi:MAG TPA: hypothetical protein VL101_05420 [Nordella sp.]|nr:hypothetical protein [Nordella sp.]
MQTAPVKAEISIEDLARIDIRVGTIVSVTEIARSRDLVHAVVDLGAERRNVVIGMRRERADVQEVVGRQALFVVNLPPRKMSGIVSEAMLFDIGYGDGITPVLAVPEKPVPDGTRAG